MSGIKNPKYKGPLKQCIKCSNKRKSKHHNCLYCVKCKTELDNIAKSKSQLQWKRNNKEHLAKYRAKNYHKWKDNINKYQRESNKKLTDTYVRGQVARGEKFSCKDVTDEMIEIKRLSIQLSRILRNK